MGNPILRYIEYIIVYAFNIRKYTSICIKGFSCHALPEEGGLAGPTAAAGPVPAAVCQSFINTTSATACYTAVPGRRHGRRADSAVRTGDAVREQVSVFRNLDGSFFV